MSKKLTQDADDEVRERRLWLRVIRRAQEEADGQQLYTGDKELAVHQARRWLTTKSKGLIDVCRNAGLSPEQTEALVVQSRKKYGKCGKGEK